MATSMGRSRKRSARLPTSGPKPETVRLWVRQAERDTGRRPGGATTDELVELKRLKREDAELRRVNDMAGSGVAAAHFFGVEFDRQSKK